MDADWRVTSVTSGLKDRAWAQLGTSASGNYKDIDEVMAAQRDLVEPLARFEPRLVKMAPSGERPED